MVAAEAAAGGAPAGRGRATPGWARSPAPWPPLCRAGPDWLTFDVGRHRRRAGRRARGLAGRPGSPARAPARRSSRHPRALLVGRRRPDRDRGRTRRPGRRSEPRSPRQGTVSRAPPVQRLGFRADEERCPRACSSRHELGRLRGDRRRRLGLQPDHRARQRGQRQAAVRVQVRDVPHAGPCRHQGHHRSQPRRGVHARPPGRREETPPSPAWSRARSSTPPRRPGRSGDRQDAGDDAGRRGHRLRRQGRRRLRGHGRRRRGPGRRAPGPGRRQGRGHRQGAERRAVDPGRRRAACSSSSRTPRRRRAR